MQGACLQYDAVDEILIATPIDGGPNCWNVADWIVIVSPCCFIVMVLSSTIIGTVMDYIDHGFYISEDDELISLSNLSHADSESPEVLSEGEEDEDNN